MNVKTLVQKGIKNRARAFLARRATRSSVSRQMRPQGLSRHRLLDSPADRRGTFKKEKSYLLALTGCAGDATIVNKDKCGPNPPAAVLRASAI